MPTFGIIGTAGRQEDKSKLGSAMYSQMRDVATCMISEIQESYGVDTLVSGGAAWADHIAVLLYLEGIVPNLILFLPCEFTGNRFHDNGIQSYKGENPGKTLNHYHLTFSQNTGLDSFAQLRKAKEKGASFRISTNFWARNGLIAKYSDILLAFTFGEKHWLKDGGTSHTMNAYLNKIKREGLLDKSFHYCLSDMTLYFPAKVNVPEKKSK